METNLAKTTLAALWLALTLFLSCADNPTLEFPSEEAVRQRYPGSSSSETTASSSSSEQSSSSLVTESSSSSEQSSSSSATVSSSSSEQSSSSAELSSSSEPSSSSAQSSSSLPSSSSSLQLSSSSVETSSSSENIVETKCDGELYDSATQFCYNNSEIVDFCGTRTETFNPDLYECREGSKIYLKTPVLYESEEYEAVLIGTQTWMARNLNYETTTGSKCANEDEANCITYGRLYKWETAMEVCPPDWHLPSNSEWRQLTTFVDPTQMSGTEKLASTSWGGTDYYGFSALPNYNSTMSSQYWCTNRYDSVTPFYMGIIHISSTNQWTWMNNIMNMVTFFYVRCVMD